MRQSFDDCTKRKIIHIVNPFLPLYAGCQTLMCVSMEPDLTTYRTALSQNEELSIHIDPHLYNLRLIC